jgi:hypothetical protein
MVNYNFPKLNLMEKINEILNNIKERFSNPLFFSFIFSWFIINWRITIGLLWHDTKQIENYGYKSIFTFIESRINLVDSFWHPLFAALAYTFLMPLIRNLIKAFYSWTSKWGDDWSLKILNTGKVSINKYLKLRGEYEKRSKILEDVITKESSYIQDVNSAKTELLSTQDKLNDIEKKLQNSSAFISQLNDLKIIQGAWENNFITELGQKDSESIFIDNYRYYVVSKLGVREETFEIKNFYYDNRNQNVFFIKELIGQFKEIRPKQEHFSINRLRFESRDMLVGTENGTTKIVYTRK